MKNLELVKSETFGTTQCDIYKNEKEYYMTREQIGAALEYSNPRKAISDIHARHRDRLDQFSVVRKLRTTDGKEYNTHVYNRKGIMEICRWSQQPKADEFVDWAWEVLDSIASGKAVVIEMNEYQKKMIATREENIRTRKAQLLTQIASKYDGTSYQQILHSYATKELAGEHLLPLPHLPEKTFSATEIGEMLGVSANMVGILANRHGLKTPQNGAWFNDKAKGHSKEVQTFRYYERAIPMFEDLLDGDGM